MHQLLYGSRASANALCTHGPGDKYWCERARALGYDSIQVRRGSAIAFGKKRKPWSELIVCTEQCGNRMYRDSACVPVARTIGKSGVVSACDCPHGAPLLSCDGVRRKPSADSFAGSGTALPRSIPGERGHTPQNAKVCQAGHARGKNGTSRSNEAEEDFPNDVG